MFVKAIEIFRDGMEKGYGVPAFNMIDSNTVRWAIEAGEAEGMPVVLQYYPATPDASESEAMRAVIEVYARRARIPVGFHLDHSRSFELFMAHIRSFDSGMIDGSHLPTYEENVSLTTEIVRISHAMGITVEGELGFVGSGAVLDHIRNADHFTSPLQAAEFVQRTGVDMLAISIGNAHGAYVAAPNLDFGRVRAIRGAVGIPLVLHGGSGVPDEQFAECARLGMSKFNVFTDMNLAFAQAAGQAIASGARHMTQVLDRSRDAVIGVFRHKIRVLNPNGLRVV